mgnify:CR=1 FL=1
MTNGVLQATDVVKSYNKKEVLHSVSLTIEPGKIYGLIGRNGAGKTTLLSILTAQNTHDSGLVTYNGERVWENQKALDEICFSRELSPMLQTMIFSSWRWAGQFCTVAPKFSSTIMALAPLSLSWWSSSLEV